MLAPIRLFQALHAREGRVTRLVNLIWFRARVSALADIDPDDAARWADDGGAQ